MQASQMSDLHYLLQPDTCHYPCYSHLSQSFTSQFYYNTSPQEQGQGQGPGQGRGQESSPNLASFSGNSTTTDEAEVSITNERKQRRMISNRESARRSRIRKRKHLDELWSQVVWLRNENKQLVDSLNNASENHDRLAEENAQLKQEVSDLRKMLLNS